jgi:hypothetical protein
MECLRYQQITQREHHPVDGCHLITFLLRIIFNMTTLWGHNRRVIIGVLLHLELRHIIICGDIDESVIAHIIGSGSESAFLLIFFVDDQRRRGNAVLLFIMIRESEKPIGIHFKTAMTGGSTFLIYEKRIL